MTSERKRRYIEISRCRGAFYVALVVLAVSAVIILTTRRQLPAITPDYLKVFPPRVAEVLQSPDVFELLSLDPGGADSANPSGKSIELFHGYYVLGRAAINDRSSRTTLIAALREGVAHAPGMVAMCFNPRHGLHLVRNGRTIDLVICFECSQAELFDETKQFEDCMISSSPKKTFNNALAAAGLPSAPQAE